jgi:hypothetical protein
MLLELLDKNDDTHETTPTHTNVESAKVHIATRTKTTSKKTATAKTATTTRICAQNPYLVGLEEDASSIARRMDDWLSPHHLREIYQEAHQFVATQWSQFAFFNPWTSCHQDHIHCLGGKCGIEESKFTCGIGTHMQGQQQQQQQQQQSSSSSKLASLTTKKKCNVYSLGGNNQWQFELDALNQTECDVHTFDCTGDISRFDRIPDHPRMYFHHVCVGTVFEPAIPQGQCNGIMKCGETWTIPQMHMKLGHDHIDLFKIDVEGYEWPILQSWPEIAQDEGKSDNGYWSLPHQIMVEIHNLADVPTMTFYTPTETVAFLEMLLRMGYVVIRRDNNLECAWCAEFTLMRIRCPTASTNSRL